MSQLPTAFDFLQSVYVLSIEPWILIWDRDHAAFTMDNFFTILDTDQTSIQVLLYLLSVFNNIDHLVLVDDDACGGVDGIT